MVKTSRTETALNNLEPATDATDDVRERDTHVRVGDFEVALRSIIVAEDPHGATKLDTRRVGGHDDDGLLLVPRRGRVRLAHDEMNRVARVSGTRDPPGRSRVYT